MEKKSVSNKEFIKDMMAKWKENKKLQREEHKAEKAEKLAEKHKARLANDLAKEVMSRVSDEQLKQAYLSGRADGIAAASQQAQLANQQELEKIVSSTVKQVLDDTSQKKVDDSVKDSKTKKK